MTSSHNTGEVWILGAAGRIGRAVAGLLAQQKVPLVLVGRNEDELNKVGSAIDGDFRIAAADSIDGIADEIRRQRPAVVVNTMGNYAATAVPIARAIMPVGHYVDMAADLAAVSGLLALDEEAAKAGSALVTGAGFGVLATESVVAMLCRGQSTPEFVRVDAVASVATEAGLMGAAFAATSVDVLTTGGRRYDAGRLVDARLGGDLQKLTLPDGQTVKTAGVPTLELYAAKIASGAPAVVATSALAPTAPVLRALLPTLKAMLSIPALRRLALRRLARTPIKAAPRPREHSWGHALVRWPDGTSRDGWLRADDGMDFTAAVAAEVTRRLLQGEARPGAFTPAAGFGPELAVACGGTFLVD